MITSFVYLLLAKRGELGKIKFEVFKLAIGKLGIFVNEVARDIVGRDTLAPETKKSLVDIFSFSTVSCWDAFFYVSYILQKHFRSIITVLMDLKTYSIGLRC